jgi:hypothetical protein
VQVIALQRIEEVVVPGKRLGRHIRIDTRSESYCVTKIHPSEIKEKLWLGSNPRALNQFDVGACVGFASAHALNACIGLGLRLDNSDALDIYALATTKDPWPGSYPEEDTGSSGLAAMQACRELGYIKSWSNAYTLDDVLSGLQTRPGILGSTWFAGCDDPSVGFGVISPTGSVRGGHETAVVGCEPDRGLIILRNSWGDDYGVAIAEQTGYFRLTYTEFSALMLLTGDVLFPDVP